MLQRQMTMTVIAQTIGVTKATVSREVKRNCDKRGKRAYRWDLAQRKYEKRMKQRPHYIKFSDEMKRDVRRLIAYGQYSPEQIAGRYKRDGKPMVCKETIYKWAWSEKRKAHPEMAQNLRHHGRRKSKRGGEHKSRGQIVDRVDISLRPPEVDEKLRFGDFEIDTIIGKNRKGAVMTINDRCTKNVFIRRLTGKEFARHKEIAKVLDVQFFFARPYHSWERGANENTNGLARQYIPKGTDFEDLTDEYIAEVEWKLNHRPRKSLGFLTPLEYFKKIYKFDFGSRCTSN